MLITEQITQSALDALKTGKLLGGSKYGKPIKMFPTPVALEWVTAKSAKGNDYISATFNYDGKDYKVFGPYGKTAADLAGITGYITLKPMLGEDDYGKIGDLQPAFHAIDVKDAVIVKDDGAI